MKGKPVIDYLLDYLAKYSITDVLINIHYKPEQFFSTLGSRVLYFYEPELLGEEKTLLSIRSWVRGDWLVTMNGDTLTDLPLGQVIERTKTEECSIRSVDNNIYTGITVYNPYAAFIVPMEFGAWWQDIGTPEGLKKAEAHYAKTTAMLSEV